MGRGGIPAGTGGVPFEPELPFPVFEFPVLELFELGPAGAGLLSPELAGGVKFSAKVCGGVKVEFEPPEFEEVIASETEFVCGVVTVGGATAATRGTLPSAGGVNASGTVPELPVSAERKVGTSLSGA